ncbi:MAG: hypothetical protein R2862_08590 [Thermoanaerobaculia bacterium]
MSMGLHVVPSQEIESPMAGSLPRFIALGRRYRSMIELLLEGNEEHHLEDRLLEFLVPNLGPAISRYYCEGGPSLEELVCADGLRRLDSILSARLARLIHCGALSCIALSKAAGAQVSRGEISVGARSSRTDGSPG